MSDEQLLPCPFCGGEASIEETDLLGDCRKSAGCNTEFCQGYQSTLTFATRREAIQAWNRRGHEAILEAANETLKEQLESEFKGVLSIRCTRHYSVPQINKTEFSGGECGACIAEEVERLRDVLVKLGNGEFVGTPINAKSGAMMLIGEAIAKTPVTEGLK